MSLNSMIHLPAVLLSFFSIEFFFFSVSECFEVILMTIFGKKEKKPYKTNQTQT